MDSNLLLILAIVLVWVSGRALSFFIGRNKTDVDIIIREEAIKNEIKTELDPMSLSALVDRANKRWADRKNNTDRRQKPD